VYELWFIHPALTYNGFPMDGVLVGAGSQNPMDKLWKGLRVSGFHSCLSDCKEKTPQQYFEGG
jgi:hypothetical protein